MKQLLIVFGTVIFIISCAIFSDYLYKKSIQTVNNNTDLMNIYKAGYYSGAYRQKLGYNADSTFYEDSVLFEKHFFKPLNKEQ